MDSAFCLKAFLSNGESFDSWFIHNTIVGVAMNYNLCFYCCQPKTSLVCVSCGNAEIDSHPLFLHPGTILEGKYILGRVLGHGGFGVTYLAFDANLEIRVAVKEFLPRELATRDQSTMMVRPFDNNSTFYKDYLDKFLDEARSLARFRHRAIVSVISYFRENGTGYMVMDYLEGETLDKFCNDTGKTLSLQKITHLIEEILLGVQYVHSQNMLHRDIKPANLILTKEGQLKLLDFGSARSMKKRNTPMTKMWTPGFAPLEQVTENGEQGPWTDLYSVGATAHHLLYGSPPPDVLERLHGQPLFMNNVPRPPFWLEKSLSMQISERFQSAEQMLISIQHESAAEHDPPSSRATFPQQVLSPSSRSSPQQTTHKETGNQQATASPEKSGSFFSKRTIMVFLGFVCVAGMVVMFSIKYKKENTPIDAAASRAFPEPTPLAKQSQPAPTKIAAVQKIPRLSPSWSSIQKAYERCHPDTLCSTEDASNAASFYHSANESIVSPLPSWVLMGWEGIALAKAKKLREPYTTYAKILERYEEWKKASGQVRSGLRFYTQLLSHRVFGQFLWFAAQNASSEEKRKLLGVLWTGWRYSPLARQAYMEWMKAVRNEGLETIAPQEIYDAAKALLRPTYRQNKLAIKFSTLLLEKKKWRKKAQWLQIRAYENLDQWEEKKATAEQRFKEISLFSRSRKKIKQEREWLISEIARSLLFTDGYEASSSFFNNHPNLSKDEQQRYLNTLLVWQQQKGDSAHAIETAKKLLSLDSASASVQHNLAALYLVRGSFGDASALWRSLLNLSSLSLEQKLVYYYWIGFAEEKISSGRGASYFQELCKNFPLSLYGLLACERLSLRPMLSSIPNEINPFSVNLEMLAFEQGSFAFAAELLALYTWNELYQPRPPVQGIYEVCVKAFAKAGDWEMAFQIFLQHLQQPLIEGKLPRSLIEIAFPRPPQIKATIQRIAKANQIEDETILAIIRRESGFSFPSFGLRVGLMGVDPLWSPQLPADDDKNIEIGAARIQMFVERLSSLPLAIAAYRGYDASLQKILSHRSDTTSPLLLLETSHLAARNYLLDPKNGTLWYYLVYKWLVSPETNQRYIWNR